MPSEPKKLTELWAWVATEPDGGEGILASSAVQDGFLMPLVGGDEARMRSLEPHARQIAIVAGVPVRLVRFSHGETVDLPSRSGPSIAGEAAK